LVKGYNAAWIHVESVLHWTYGVQNTALLRSPATVAEQTLPTVVNRTIHGLESADHRPVYKNRRHITYRTIFAIFERGDNSTISTA